VCVDVTSLLLWGLLGGSSAATGSGADTDATAGTASNATAGTADAGARSANTCARTTDTSGTRLAREPGSAGHLLLVD
jgi:hypothetical protein